MRQSINVAILTQAVSIYISSCIDRNVYARFSQQQSHFRIFDIYSFTSSLLQYRCCASSNPLVKLTTTKLTSRRGFS